MTMKFFIQYYYPTVFYVCLLIYNIICRCFQYYSIILVFMCVSALAWGIIPQDIGFQTETFSYSSWRIFALCTNLPSYLTAALLCFLPESPKFLMCTGREKEALDVFNQVYTTNYPKSIIPYPVRVVYHSNDFYLLILSTLIGEEAWNWYPRQDWLQCSLHQVRIFILETDGKADIKFVQKCEGCQGYHRVDVHYAPREFCVSPFIIKLLCFWVKYRSDIFLPLFEMNHKQFYAPVI